MLQMVHINADCRVLLLLTSLVNFFVRPENQYIFPEVVTGTDRFSSQSDFPYSFWEITTTKPIAISTWAITPPGYNYNYHYGDRMEYTDHQESLWNIQPIQLPDDLVGAANKSDSLQSPKEQQSQLTSANFRNVHLPGSTRPVPKHSSQHFQNKEYNRTNERHKTHVEEVFVEQNQDIAESHPVSDTGGQKQINTENYSNKTELLLVPTTIKAISLQYHKSKGSPASHSLLEEWGQTNVLQHKDKLDYSDIQSPNIGVLEYSSEKSAIYQSNSHTLYPLHSDQLHENLMGQNGYRPFHNKMQRIPALSKGETLIASNPPFNRDIERQDLIYPHPGVIHTNVNSYSNTDAYQAFNRHNSGKHQWTEPGNAFPYQSSSHSSSQPLLTNNFKRKNAEDIKKQSYPTFQIHRRPMRTKANRFPIFSAAKRPASLFPEYFKAAEETDRFPAIDGSSPSFFVPGGLAIIALSLALFYFNFVWYPTPVVTARLADAFTEKSALHFINPLRPQAVNEIYEVVRSFEAEHSSSGLDSSGACRSRLVCQVHSEFPELWPITQESSALLKDQMLNSESEDYILYEYLSAAIKGTQGQDCNKIYSDCPLPGIFIKPVLKHILGTARIGETQK